MLNQLFDSASYSFNPYALPPLGTSILLSTLGIYVFAKEKKSTVRSTFLLLCISASLWLAGFAIVYSSSHRGVALFWYTYVTFLGVSTVSPGVYTFTVSYLKLLKQQKVVVLTFYLIALLFYLSAITSAQFITDMRKYFWGWYPLYGPLSYPFLAFFFILMAASLAHFWAALIKARSQMDKRRAFYMLLGLLVAFTGTVDFLPKFEIELYPFGYIPIVFFMLCITYAIVKYKLLTITPALAADSLINTMADSMIVFAPDRAILLTNHVVNELTGYGPDELIGKPVDMLFAERVFDNTLIEALLNKVHIQDHELMLRTKSGNIVPASFSGSVMTNRDGEPMAIVGIVRDISERKHAENLIQNILSSMDEGLAVIDSAYRIITANRAFSERVGIPVPDISGEHCYRILHQSDAPCYQAGEDCAAKYTFDTGKPHVVIHEHVNNEQHAVTEEIKTYPMKDMAGNVVSVIVTVNDITEKRRLEDQLRHAQKMEAVGQLAGGVAHDFNNILTAIVGYGSMLRMKLGKDEVLARHVDQILTATERAAALTQSLLAFSRKKKLELKPVDVNDVVKRTKKLLLHLIGEDVVVSASMADNPKLSIMGDSGQIEQVLMNLATNARDAMPNGGRFTIVVERVLLDESFRKNHGYGMPGEYALISVTDDGQGMDNDTSEKIFEPFFTTKEVGKGTGLGLSIAYGIIKQHNGYINCSSRPGKGTTFNIYLPLVQAEVVDGEPFEHVQSRGGKETILIAEDDVYVRKLTQAVLEEFGYTTIIAENGEEAIQSFKRNGENIDLLLLDVIMPKKNGKEVYEEIQAMRPDIKVLFMSGYTADLIHTKSILKDALNVVAKPISPPELLSAIRNALDN